MAQLDSNPIWRITAPHFCAGLILSQDVCRRAAPILHYMVGWNGARIKDYARSKRWRVEVLEQPKEGAMEGYYRIDYQVPATHSYCGEAYWMTYDGGRRIEDEDEARLLFAHLADSEEWPYRLVKVTEEVMATA